MAASSIGAGLFLIIKGTNLDFGNEIKLIFLDTDLHGFITVHYLTVLIGVNPSTLLGTASVSL